MERQLPRWWWINRKYTNISSTPEIEGVLGELESEAGEEVVDGVPKPFLEEVPEGGDHEVEDAFAGIELEEEGYESLPEVGERA